jgi:prepilin-type N-terminal cleavage/methylation domain-containing protein
MPTALKPQGFTLIELLIVVAIVAILSAIAVPNFLEAQTRSKISRVRNDLRVLDGALAAYQVDFGFPPPTVNFFDPLPRARLARVTSPVAYLSSLPRDPFSRRHTGVFEETIRQLDPSEPLDIYVYNTGSADFGLGHAGAAGLRSQYSLASGGPDLVLEFPYYAFSPTFVGTGVYLGYIYDPTNGTVSRGEIFRRGGHQPDQIPGLHP